MPWYAPWSDHIAKRVCKYLLQRFLGQFLEEKLTLDQLDINLFQGIGSITDVALDVQALNDLAEQQNLPFQFVDGFIEEIAISIPWSSFLVDSLSIKVTGMLLTAKFRERDKSKASMLESMWSSMSSSMQLAEECLRNEQNCVGGTNVQNFEGIERFAQTIDLILSRIKLIFIKSSIRLEEVNYENKTGVALIMTAERMNYFDEDAEKIEKDDLARQEYLVPAFSTKKVLMEGVAFFTEEFDIKKTSDDEDGLCESFEYAEKSPECQSVLMGRLAGRQEVTIKFNQEGSSEPKVELGINLGALIIFATPSQIHKMILIAKGASSGKSRKGPLKSRVLQKPMEAADFQKIENELFSMNTMQRQNVDLDEHGWSKALEDNSDDEFMPIKNRKRYGGSLSSSAASSMCSSTSSFASSSRSPSQAQNFLSEANRKPQSLSGTSIVDSEPLPLIFSFEIRISSIAGVILQEDLAASSLAASSELNRHSEKFFASLGHFTESGFGNKDFCEARQVFLNACHRNHLRILAAPLILQGSESVTSHGTIFKGIITTASAEISECLMNNDNSSMENFELLSFLDSSSDEIRFDNEPAVRLHFKISNIDSSYALRKRSATNKSSYSIILQPLRAEIDVTLIDRLSPLLNLDFSNWKKMGDKNHHNLKFEEFLFKSIDNILPKQDCRLTAKSATLKLRFPIPDLRPMHDMNRAPWWTRNLRGDILILNLKDLSINTTIDLEDPVSKIEFQAREIILQYQAEDGESPKTIAEAGVDPKSNTIIDGASGFGWPRVVVTVYPENKNFDLEAPIIRAPTHPMHLSVLSNLENTKRREPSPFSSKTVIYGVKESDGVDLTDEHAEGEELITPASKEEMAEFIDLASRGTKINLDISLPVVSALLPSKQVYELLYNRITTDLLLWTPSAPFKGAESFSDDQLFYPTFNLCKSGINYESDSDESESFEPYRHRRKGKSSESIRKGQSKMVVNLVVGQGLADLFLPVRDGQGNIIPGQSGEVLLSIENSSLFYVKGFGGKKDCSYICMQVNHFSLNHCALINDSWNVPKLRRVGDVVPHYLEQTLYQVEPEASLDHSTAVGTGHFQSLDMLTFALKLDREEKSRSLKIFKVAIGLRNTQLRHRVCASTKAWYNQVVDFFDVDDYPIMGYEPSVVLTEINLHLWNSNIDYRPLYLPYRCVINLGGFNISSNIAAKTKTSTIRLVSEDASLFISDILGTRPQLTGVNLRRDFVCVMEIGLFELSMRLNDMGRNGRPGTDLRATADCLHLRTCADSAKALAELVTYFAGDGDLQPASSLNDLSLVSAEKEDVLVQTAEQDDLLPSMTKSQESQLHDLMADAIAESTTSKDYLGQSLLTDKPPTVAYFTCSESQISNESFGHLGSELAVDKEEEVDVFDDDSWEKEFFILDREAGVGLLPKKGVPEVRFLTDHTIRLVENHFSLPSGKTDLLRSPRHYPKPVHRYTLEKLNLVWQMYGGHDLNNDNNSAKSIVAQKRVNIQHSTATSEKPSREVHVVFSNSKTGPGTVCFNQSASEKSNSGLVNWKEKGGRSRSYDVLMELQLTKVRFQHETYPDDANEASRQVLLIKDVELKDRLASSQINKFLYQYSSESTPKQSHANMVMIKSVQVRVDPKLPSQETCLRVALLPLRLNIDQDSLLFLYRFFSEISCEEEKDKEERDEEEIVKNQTPTHSASKPIMLVTPNEKDKQLSILEPAPPLIQLEEHFIQPNHGKSTRGKSVGSHKGNSLTFFRSFVFSPEVLVKIDYQGKHVDMSHGPLAGLLMGLAQLNNSEFRLKKIVHRHGLLGLEKLLTFAINEWTNDIKRNQLPGLLGGVGPIYSIVQLLQGIRDLFWLPIEQYQRDGRLVRGFQRGASSFTTSSAMAVLELTSRLIQIIQTTAETAYDMVSPGPSLRHIRRRNKRQPSRKKQHVQPVDIREGVANAITLVKDGLGETAQTLVQVATEEHAQKGVTGAVGGVLRQIPPTVVKPLILATEATNNVLVGMRSQLVPDARREAVQKWRREDI